MFRYRQLSLALVLSLLAADLEAQRAIIRVQPNLGTQSKDGFTVCVGTTSNRAQYGTSVTGSTGVVQFAGLPLGTGLVVTVTKGGYIGREQALNITTAATPPETVVYMFGGNAGPTCGTISSSTPPTSTVRVTIAPGGAASAIKDGFYVCLGTAQNRAAYGAGLTNTSGVRTFNNVPAGSLVKATVVKAGYEGIERDFYPTAGSETGLTIDVPLGQLGFSCPGYTPNFLRTLTVTVMDGFNRVSGAYVCLRAGSNEFRPTVRTDTRGQVAFSGLDQSSGWWTVVASNPGKAVRVDISGPHYRDTSIVLAMASGTNQPPCAGTPPPPQVTVTQPGTTITALTPDPPRLGKEALGVIGDAGWHSNAEEFNCMRFGTNYVMTGLRGRHRTSNLAGIDIYCAPLRSDGTLGTRVFLPAISGNGDGTSQEISCPAGHAVTGMRGSFDGSTIGFFKSVTIQCAALGSTGLTSGTVRVMAPLGIPSTKTWGPSACTQNRPATGLAGTNGTDGFLASVTIQSLQMMCEQPLRPQPR